MSKVNSSFQRSAHIFLVVSSIVSLFYVAILNTNSGYSYLFLLPLSYCVLYLCAVKPLLFRAETSLFLYMTTVVFYLRYVVYPFFVVYSGNYVDGRTISLPTASVFQEAIFLMTYEFLISVLVICWLERRYQKKSPNLHQEITLRPLFNYPIYLLSIVLLLIALLIDRSWVNIITSPGMLFSDANFDLDSTDRTFGLRASIMGNLFYTARNLIFVAGVMYASRRRFVQKRLKNSSYYILLILLFAMISLFQFGLNRMKIAVVVCCGAYFVCQLVRPFVSTLRQFLMSMIGVLIIPIIAFMAVTELRNYYVDPNSTRAEKTAESLQAYLGGVHNVAIAIDLEHKNPNIFTGKMLLYDFLRPTIGIGLLVKDWDVQYSNQLFNRRIYLSDHMAQIIPMIGQGYLYGGFLFAPFLGILFVSMAYVFLIVGRKYNISPFFSFYLYLCIFRLALFPGQNSMNMMNYISFNLLIVIVLEMLNNSISRKSHIR